MGQAPRSFPGVLLVFGWSLFVLVLVNSYAANLVAVIIKEVVLCSLYEFDGGDRACMDSLTGETGPQS